MNNDMEFPETARVTISVGTDGELFTKSMTGIERFQSWINSHGDILSPEFRREIIRRASSLQDNVDRLCDDQWIAGCKVGWNIGVSGNVDELNECINGRIAQRIVREGEK